MTESRRQIVVNEYVLQFAEPDGSPPPCEPWSTCITWGESLVEALARDGVAPEEIELLHEEPVLMDVIVVS